MMKRVFVGLALLFTILGVFFWFLFYSEAGLQFLVARGEALTSGRLKVESATGKIGKELVITGLSFQDEGQSLQLGSVHLAWQPLSIFRGEIHLTELAVNTIRYTATAKKEVEDKSDGFSLPEIVLPFSILLEKTKIEDVEIISAPDTIIQIDSVEVRMATIHEHVAFDTLEIKARDHEIFLSGSLGLQQSWPAEFRGEWKGQIGDYPKTTGKFSLAGSLKKGRLTLQMDIPFVVELVTDFGLDNGVRWQSELISREVNPGLFFREFPGFLNLEASMKGQIEPAGITTELDLKKIEGQLRSYPLLLQSRASFRNKVLEINEFKLKSGASEVFVNGALGEAINLKFGFKSPDIAELYPQATGYIEAQGHVSGNWQRPQLRLDIEGREVAGQGVKIGSIVGSLDGVVHKTEDVFAEISVQEIEKDTTHIDSIDLQFSGGLERHQVQIKLRQQKKQLILDAWGKIIDNSWRGEVEKLYLALTEKDIINLEKPVQVVVSPEKTEVGELCLLHEGGKVCSAGWWQMGKWQAEAQLWNIDPGVFFESLPGKINGRLMGQGDLSGAGGKHSIELQTLTGNLKGNTLGGSGTVSINGADLRFQDFSIQLGEASLEMKGTLSNNNNDFFIDGIIPDLAEFIPEGGGNLSFSGSLKGHRQTPAANFVFHGGNVNIAGTTVQKVGGKVAADLGQGGEILSDIKISGMVTDFLKISDGQLQVKGTTEKHDLEFYLSTSEGDIRLAGQGAYDSHWKGGFSHLSVISNNYGEWFLDGDTRVQIGSEMSFVDDFCLRGEKAHVCVNSSYDLDKNWDLGVDISTLDLSFFNDLHMVAIPMEGNLRGTLNGQGRGGSIAALDLEVNVPSLQLEGELGEEPLSYSFQENSLIGHLKDDRLDLKLQFQAQEDSSFTSDIWFTGVRDFSTDLKSIPLGGRVNVNFNDLSVVTLLTNSQVKAKGELQGDVNFSGRVGSPVLQGDLHLRDGAVELSNLGVTIEALALKLKADKDSLDFELTGKSGEGELKGQGSYSRQLQNGWQVSAKVTGSDFEVIATEEYKIKIDPDLQFVLDQESGKLWGDLHIPSARIALEGTGGKVSSSGDIVFVDETEEKVEKKRLFATDIAIVLGDDVTIDGFGLKSHLVGNLKLKDIPGKTLTAIGELVVKDGTFALYSVELKINRGRLLFGGGPIENPGVDFRALRKVDKKDVGVEVSGTVDDNNIRLFSDPFMEDSEIMAHLLVGKSMTSSSDEDKSLVTQAVTALGVGGANSIFGTIGDIFSVDEIYLDGGEESDDMSLVLGKNITENLFIGYGYNLFDSEGNFKARYILGKGFSVETESSAEATSGDIFYSIER